MSRPTYDVSAAARLDLLNIWNYLAEHASITVADRVSRDIEAGITKIVRLPTTGHRRPDLTDRDIRFYRVHRYLVIYRTDTKPLHVLRVLHASQDLQSILRQ